MVSELSELELASVWRRHLLWFSAALGALGVVHFDTFADMVGVWEHSSTFNHCFLIPFIAAYLALDKRGEVAAIAPDLSVFGLLYVALNSVLWLVGDVMSVAFGMHMAVVGMLIGSAWALLGNRVFKALAFPFFYLYFTVPEGEFLVPYLQDWTAAVLLKLLQLTGIPVFIEGRYLTIPSGTFVVAEACSGVNYLIATLSVGTMFMYLQFRAWWRRLLFAFAIVLVPLLANGVRAYGIVMISHLSNYKYAQGVDHFIYGWVFFGVVIFALFAIGNVFSDYHHPPAPTPTQAPAAAVAQGHLFSWMLAALLLAALPRGALYLLDAARPSAATIALPSVPGWQGPTPIESALDPEFVGADQHLSGGYTSSTGAAVTLDVVYYSKQGAGRELVNQTNRIFNKAYWQQVDYSRRSLAANASVQVVDALSLRHADSDMRLFWTWYDSHGHRSAQRLTIKFAEGMARLRGENQGGAFVAIGTSQQDQQQASTALAAFVASGAVTLERMHAAP